MKTGHRRWLLPVYYTVAFAVIAALSFGVFRLANRTMIWKLDGITQHYPMIIELHRLLADHGLAGVAGWSWTFGLGADKLTTLAYYVLGDPFAYALALLPTRLLEAGYGWFIVIRLYATGLAFLPLAKHYQFKPLSQVLGALTYAFTGYSLMVGVHHPFFLLPMILAPLLFVGIDRILQGKSWLFLGIITGIAILSNFYFAYILGLGSLIYAGIRFFSRKSARTLAVKGWQALYRFVLAAVVGVLLSGILILPSLLMMLHSTRAAATFANGLWLYPISYYLKLGNAVLTTGNGLSYWSVLGISGLGFFGCVYVLVHWKSYRYLAGTLIAIVLGLSFPAVAAFFNVLSTPSNRWLLLAAVPINLAAMALTDHLTDLTPLDRRWLVGGAALLLLVVYLSNGLIFDNPGRNLITYGLFLALAVVLAGGGQQPNKLVVPAVCTLVAMNLVSNAWGYFNPNASQQATQELRRGDATKFITNYYDGAESVPQAAKTFSRINQLLSYNVFRTAGNNYAMLHNLHGVMSYFSVENGYVGQFSQDLGNAQYQMNSPMTQLDNRSTMNQLLGVKTIFARQDQVTGTTALPYGYRVTKKLFDEKPVYGLSNGIGTQLLSTDLNFPLVYSQPQALTQKEWQKLDETDRERSLTQAAVVGKRADGVAAADYQSPGKEVAYTVTPNTASVIDSTNKLIQYRVKEAFAGQKDNLNSKQSANFGDTLKAPKFTVDENGLMTQAEVEQYKPMARLNHNKVATDRVLTQNQQIVEQTTAANQDGLHQLTSDALAHPISYTLTLERPKQAQGTELYLDLSGIAAQKLTTQDKLTAQDNDSVLGATPRSRLTKLNDWRDAMNHQDLGDYWVKVKTRNSMKTFTQLGIDNMSDYEPKHHVLLNLGYSTQKRQTVDITFNSTRQITFKSAKLIAMSFNRGYDQQVHRVQQRGLQDAQVNDNRVTGNLTTTRASVLTTSIPYSDGWRLTVDGKPTATQVVNDGFVGANLTSGTHRIVLTYQTPGLKLGALLSGLGLVGLVIGGLFSLYRWIRRPITRNHRLGDK